MKLLATVVLGVSVIAVPVLAQQRTTGLNNHFDPEPLTGPLAPYGYWVCVTLPPGFDRTGDAQLRGAQTALSKQGDEGLEETRHRFVSPDSTCKVELFEVPDENPLPNELP